MQRFRAFFKDTAETLFVALLIALVVRAFLLQIFWIPSASMEPTLMTGDRLIVDKLSLGVQNPLYDMNDSPVFLFNIPNPLYNTNFPLSDIRYIVKLWQPQRMEILVFKYPKDPLGTRRDFIKRLIGLPGEEIEIKNGVVYIDDQPIKEEHTMAKDAFDMPKVRIPEGHYFMMGDNRPNSADSRYWGFVPGDYFVGRALFRIWPILKIGPVPK
ncbi:MAG: signal peptidase I [Candidatus Margulisiibacteriota bacterium]